MTFDLPTILIFVVGALLYAALLPGALARLGAADRQRDPDLPLAAAAADPLQRFHPADGDLVLTVACWWFTARADQAADRSDRLTFGVIALLVLGMSLMRFVDADYRLTASRPPEPLAVVVALALATAVVLGASLLVTRLTTPEGQPRVQKRTLWLLIGLIVILFVALKSEPLATEVARAWRGGTGQDTTLAAFTDLNWLGFSYVAFRLIHTLRDRQSGLLPALAARVRHLRDLRARLHRRTD